MPKATATNKKAKQSKQLSSAEVVLDVSQRVAREASLDVQLRIIVEALKDITESSRGSLFLNDPGTKELYSRVLVGGANRELRFLNNTGIAGWVFSQGVAVVSQDAYSDPRFNRDIDQKTGYKTRNILCAPITTVTGEIIGVSQSLNKKSGDFTDEDLSIMQAITTQASIVLQNTVHRERMEQLRKKESDFLNIVSEVSSEIHLGPLLQMIMNAVTRMLDADRSTLFVNDEKTNELHTQIGQGLGAKEIRLPNTAGIAGMVFTTGKSVNIPHAYADLRFNTAIDKETGYFTRSMLCCPVINKNGKTIGVTQVLNKRGGPFTASDEARLNAFTSQISIGLENAKLFANVQEMKNYNESMLESMSNGVITLDEDNTIVTCNQAGLRIMGTKSDDVVGAEADTYFAEQNAWVMDRVKKVREEQQADILLDVNMSFGQDTVSVNATILPLTDESEEHLGTMLVIEDISSEKRMKSTMSRYMDAGLADKLMAGGNELLGGKSSEATILFSDIRAFTTLSEELGAQGIVQLLNDYFTEMVDVITEQGGMLDKFIGDALMAVFGTPFPHDDDPDRGVRAALNMMTGLNKFNQARQALDLHPIDIGIGLNTGRVVSGNIGSPKRMDYTVIGDGVNLAARLESATKQYGAHILISENTYTQLKGTYRARQVDRVVVKGKTKPVGVFELLDYHNEESFPHIVEALGKFRDGMRSYREGDWKKGREKFATVLKMNPQDSCSKMYVERCDHLAKNVDPKDWDGIWKLTSK